MTFDEIWVVSGTYDCIIYQLREACLIRHESLSLKEIRLAFDTIVNEMANGLTLIHFAMRVSSSVVVHDLFNILIASNQ